MVASDHKCAITAVLSYQNSKPAQLVYNQSNIYSVFYSTGTPEEAVEDTGGQLEHGKHVILSPLSFT